MKNDPVQDRAEGVLSLAGMGYAILAVTANAKKPATANGLRDATTDQATIRTWAEHGLNFGLLAPERVLILDIDQPELLPQLEARFTELRRAPLCRTPRGGGHYYLRLPDGVAAPPTAAGVKPGVDLRGLNNAYVLISPSQTSQGAYTWQRGPTPPELLPFATGELLEYLTPDKPTPPPPNRTLPPRIPPRTALRAYGLAALQGEYDRMISAVEGTRNDTLVRCAFSLGTLVPSGALNENDIIETLTHAALLAGLARTETQKTLLSGLEAGMLEPRDVSQVGRDVTAWAAKSGWGKNASWGVDTGWGKTVSWGVDTGWGKKTWE